MFYRIWDLVYSKAFRAVGVVVVLAGVIVGAAALGARFQPDDAVEVADVTEAPATFFASKCQESIAALTEVVDAVPSITILNTAEREAFVAQYATAARTCSYIEFVDVDRTTVAPFAAGASLFATLDSGMYLDADAADGAADGDDQEVAGR